MFTKLEFQTAFSASEDLALLTQMIIDAIKGTPQGKLTVFFIGEAHADPVDVQRRKGILDKFAAYRGCVVVAERTFAEQYGGSNMVKETSAASSADPARNADIVKALLSKLGQLPEANTIVFVFGEDHECRTKGEHDMIRERLEREWAKTDVTWYSCPAVSTALMKLPVDQSAQFSIQGRKPAGYAVSFTDEKDYKVAALAKGYIAGDFNIKLLPALCADTGNAYAIYYEDANYNEQVRERVSGDGEADVTIVRIGQIKRVTSRRVSKLQVAAAERGQLT